MKLSKTKICWRFNCLPYQFRQNNEFRYIFTIIDHFSKMADSFLLIEKTGNNIVDCLKKFIGIYGTSNENVLNHN